MYNDYESEVLDNLTSINNSFQLIHMDIARVEENQEAIKQQVQNQGILIVMVISIILIYKFVERCLR